MQGRPGRLGIGALSGAVALAPLLSAAGGVAWAADAAAGPETAAIAPGAAAVWTQWRGPDRDGHVGGAPWVPSLDGLVRQWRVSVGKGFPGPIVARDRVFVVHLSGDQSSCQRQRVEGDATL